MPLPTQSAACHVPDPLPQRSHGQSAGDRPRHSPCAAPRLHLARGYDTAKQVNGRKRHILGDTMGLLLAVAVHPADIPSREGARQVLPQAGACGPRLQHL